MSDTLLVGYGGFGCSCVSEYARRSEIPALLLDNHAPAGELSIFTEFMELGSDLTLDESRVRNAISGYRNILLVTSLGGASFSEAYRILSGCAIEEGINTVSLCTVPFVFETERRTRAFENLDILSHTAQGIVVIDSQRTITADCSPEDFVNGLSSRIYDILDVLYPLMESYPHKSLCTERIYTVSYGKITSFPESLAHAYFDVPRITGKVIIFTETEPSPMEREQVEDEMSSITGILPEFVSGPMSGKDSGLLLIPVHYEK